MSGLDQTVVVTVLPQVVLDLHVSFTRLDDAAWIVTAYLLGYTAAMPLLGRMADVHGPRRVFVASAIVFASGSAWAAVADELWELVVARGVQAVGGGGLVPVGLAVAAGIAGDRVRLLALGLVAGAAEAGAVLGPLYGAAMVDWLGWRSVFWINLPLAVALIAAAAFLPRRGATPGVRVDYPGALLIGLALFALTLGLSRESLGVTGGYRVALLAGAALLTGAFVLRQARTPIPLLPLALYRSRPLAAAVVANLLVGAALIVALVQIPLFASTVLGESSTAAGLFLLRLTALIPVGALAGGWLAGRLPYRTVAAAGMLAAGAGFLRLARWDEGISDPALTLDLALTGFGFGVVLAPLAGSALGPARGGSEGVAAASLTIARTVGMLVGLASLTAWGVAEFNERVSGLRLPLREKGQGETLYQRLLDEYDARVTDAALFVFDRLFLTAAILCLLAAVPALWLRRTNRS